MTLAKDDCQGRTRKVKGASADYSFEEYFKEADESAQFAERSLATRIVGMSEFRENYIIVHIGSGLSLKPQDEILVLSESVVMN